MAKVKCREYNSAGGAVSSSSEATHYGFTPAPVLPTARASITGTIS